MPIEHRSLHAWLGFGVRFVLLLPLEAAEARGQPRVGQAPAED
jgi:hypothetical protein